MELDDNRSAGNFKALKMPNKGLDQNKDSFVKNLDAALGMPFELTPGLNSTNRQASESGLHQEESKDAGRTPGELVATNK